MIDNPGPPTAPRRRPLLTAGLALAAALGALSPPIGEAADAWGPLAPPGAPVVVTHGLPAEEALWVAEELTGLELAEGTVPTEMDAPAFLDPLREALLLARLDEHRAHLPQCKDLDGDLPRWLEEARALALQLDAEGARQAQRSAQAAFECTPDAIPGEVVAQLMSIPGLISGYSRELVEARPTDETVLLLRDVYVVSPTARLAGDPHGDILAAAAVAQELATLLPRASVSLPVDDLPGVALWIDGQPTNAPRISLTEGRHFVQLVDRGGRARFGASFVVGGEAGALTEAVIPASMLPPDRAALMADLRVGTISGTVPPPTRSAAGALLSQEGRPWLVIATADPGADRLIGIAIDPSGALDHRRFDPPRRGCAAAGWTTAVMGLASVAGAAIWAPAYFEKQHAKAIGGDWYTEEGHTEADAALLQRRLMFGVGLGWGAATVGITTLGISRAAGCASR